MKILHIIKTKRFNSDGRLIKWINSLSEHNIKSEVLILEDINIPKVTHYDNTPVNSISLKSRNIFSKKKGYLFKIPEYSVKCISRIRKSKADIILFHDVQQYLNLLILCFIKKFSFNKKIVWDLHELPHNSLMRIFITRWILKFILKNVDLVIYTNEERHQYLIEKLNIKEKQFVILNNYPDKAFINSPHVPLDNSISMWLGGMPYVLWMGVASKGRNFQSFINIYDKYKAEFKVIIMGSVSIELESAIKKYIDEKYIYTTFVPQSEIIQFVDNALFSIVLYAGNNPNNLYCEPNRLYQLITRKIPVITGNNPPMQNITEKFNAGFVLNDDGANQQNLDSEIKKMLEKASDIKIGLIHEDMTILSWDRQFEYIYNNIKKIF